MISLAYSLTRNAIIYINPNEFAYIEFVQTQNQCTVHPVKTQTNLKSVWTMTQFFSVLRRIKSGLLCAVHSLFQQLPLHHQL